MELNEDDVARINGRCTIEGMKSGAAAAKSGFLKVNIRKGMGIVPLVVAFSAQPIPGFTVFDCPHFIV